MQAEGSNIAKSSDDLPELLEKTCLSRENEVVNAKRRLELIGLLSQTERFDFEAAEPAWGWDT